MPRIWEKIEDKLRDGLSKKTGISKKIADWALKVGYESTLKKVKG